MALHRSNTRPKTLLRAAALAALLCGAPAAAAPQVGPSVAVGEYMNLPGPPLHAGAYLTLGIWASFNLGKVVLIPQIAAELAPETRQWGFVPTLTLDFPVHKRVGVDLVAMLMHNQFDFEWDRAEVLLGAGPGCSVYLGAWTLSPNAVFLYNFMSRGWAFFPGIGVSRTFQ